MDIRYLLVLIALVIVGAIVQNKLNAKRKKSISKNLTEMMIGNRLRIILESAAILEKTKDFGTFYSRLNVMLDSMQDIMNFYSKDFTNYVRYYYGLRDRCEAKTNKCKGALEIICASRTSVRCPYCNHIFETEPSRKRKCPECKATIFRLKEDGIAYLITETEYELLCPKIDGRNKDVEIAFIRTLVVNFSQFSRYYEHIDISAYQSDTER
ncbi:MAG: zinc-ribbon domain-containing protein [Candidatus Cloacimonetes bacterium]|nr:zinc-ribbon domain-containing protein [Candidatus Cloacimonadota bacterium]MDY0230660.1 hypothetical protein [Candidatus Cloacimonadaceae bacterium]